MNNIINLEDYRVFSGTKKSKVFTGRDRGEYVRKLSRIDEIESQNAIVKVIIPDEIYSINPSFLEELFKNVVKKLGRGGFYSKFQFESLGNYNIHGPLNEAVDRILREATALG